MNELDMGFNIHFTKESYKNRQNTFRFGPEGRAFDVPDARQLYAMKTVRHDQNCLSVDLGSFVIFGIQQQTTNNSVPVLHEESMKAAIHYYSADMHLPED